MGRGFLEPSTRNAWRSSSPSTDTLRIPAQLPIMYKGRTLTQFYKADFICYDKIIIEVKAVSGLINEHGQASIT